MNADEALNYPFSLSMQEAGGISTTIRRETNLRAVTHHQKKEVR